MSLMCLRASLNARHQTSQLCQLVTIQITSRKHLLQPLAKFSSVCGCTCHTEGYGVFLFCFLPCTWQKVEILASLKEFWLSIERQSEGQSLWLWTCQTTLFCLFFCDYLTRVSEVQSLKILATDRRKDCGVLQIQQRQTSLFLKTWQHSDRAANDEDTAYRQAAQCWNSWNIQINTWAPHEVLRLNVDSRYLQY